ncbi:tyrosine-type recombinase/integrase [Frondihabitans cladoniiphilus]|uniref:Site-specific recombinase XerD n=1 Tax=Frondihabitans cladoniiphilus TaxID=715785 RepID=A0ABP8W6Z9_9MICO
MVSSVSSKAAAGELAALVAELEEDERLRLRPARKVSGKAMDAKQREAAERSRTGAALQRAAGRGVRPPAPKKTAEQLARESLSESTVRAYRSDLRQFARWLAGFEDHEPHDPDDIAGVETAPRTAKEVADFLAAKSQSEISPGMRRYSPATVTRYLAAINWEHTRLHYDPPGNHPRVRDTLKGIRRDDPPPIARAAPLTLKPLQKTLRAIELSDMERGAINTRDFALLLFGFVGAFRESELVALDVGDLRLVPDEGVRVQMRRSKTRQEGGGRPKVIRYGSNPLTCGPCAFLRLYRLQAAQEQHGQKGLFAELKDATNDVHICDTGMPPICDRLDPAAPFFRALSKWGLFRASRLTPTAVGKVLQTRVRRAGLEDIDGFSGHSMRAGFITEALNAGATDQEIMDQTDHRSSATLRIYDREYTPLRRNASTRIKL